MKSIQVTRDQSRAIDRTAIDEYGFSGLVLMENAGRGCVDVIEQLGIRGRVLIVCGKGNNAGDGFVLARHLAIRDHACRVLLIGRPDELRGDAAANFALLRSCEIPVATLANDEVAPNRLDDAGADADWIVDALLGTGAVGEPRAPFDVVIDWINAQATRVMAVDVPSGLDCDSGQPSKHTVRAHHTCTFAATKTGFQNVAAVPFTGTVHVCDIGVPARVIREAAHSG